MTPSAETLQFLETDYSMKREVECIAIATKQEMEILRGDGHTLVFDLDSEDAYKTFMSRVHFLESKFFMQRLVVTKSKSSNYHAVAYLQNNIPAISKQMALAIQACMGSDWKKEMLGVLRDWNYQAGDSLLFRPKNLEVVFEWERVVTDWEGGKL